MSDICHGVYRMDMVYPMGPLMECPMGGWIPLNLPWKYPMTHAMYVASNGMHRGFAVEYYTGGLS